ncbi:hypothetical protein L3Y34_016205 [Caenorhabditis briggsae]|uniref:F-box domain-containing protein n=1 Tax=Caenorhabditis briggsae TaxID=6238 RepID=A0AAE9DWS9_CAEBR|nr:hypothetical protein L3Y34_016205 [Caenorhabditis briggsae]
MPIPLLNLPTDLVEEIFNLCNPLQLFVLSSCSKRTRKLVKSKVTNKWKISSLTSTSIYLKGNRREEYRFKIDEYPKNCYCSTVSIIGSILHLTYSNEAVAQLLEDLVNVFGCRRAPFIKASAFNDFEKFLDLCRVLIKKNLEVRRLELDCKNKDMSGFIGLWKQMKISKIHISHSFWVTIEQLLECTSVKFELEDSELTNQDVDLFLRKWKTTGTFSKLQMLEISSEEIDKKSKILDTVPPIGIARNSERRVNRGFDPQDPNIFDGVRINKDDGTEAYLSVKLGAWTGVQFLVVNPASTVMEE